MRTKCLLIQVIISSKPCCSDVVGTNGEKCVNVEVLVKMTLPVSMTMMWEEILFITEWFVGVLGVLRWKFLDFPIFMWLVVFGYSSFGF